MAARKSTARSTATTRSARTSRPRNSNSTHASLSDVKSDVVALRDDAGRLVHGLEEAAVEKVSELAGRSKEELVNAHDRIKEFVGQRPITSLAIALGVGAVLARIMR